MTRSARVYLVGAGPGDPGLLTLKGARALAAADAILYDSLASPQLLEHCRPESERHFVGKRAGGHHYSQPEICALMIALARAGKTVVRLKGGDPFVFGRGGEEAEELAAAGIPFEIVPGVTSAVAGPAYAGIPVTHRAHNTAFTIATGHEDPTKTAAHADFADAAGPGRTLVLLMGLANLPELAQRLRRGGIADDTPVAAIGNATKPTQRTIVATLATIADEVARAGLTSPALIVVGDVVTLRERIAWFEGLPLFGKRVLIMRPRGQSEELETLLREAAAEPVLAPAIEIRAPDDPAAAAAAVARLGEYDWVVFTSRNGVEALFAALRQAGRDARAFGSARVAAIGAKTAEALTARGIRADLVPGTYVAEALAELLVERTAPGERFLLFRAQTARDVLPERLVRSGRHVDVVAAYKTVAAQDPNFASKVAASDVLLFTSSSTVDAYVHNLGGAARELSEHKIVASIGPVTAATLRAAGLEPTFVASEFTIDGLMQTLHAVKAVREPVASPS